MTFSSFFRERLSRLNMLDLKLAQAAAMCVMVILVKLVPDILKINIWWFILLAVILGFRPIYVFYRRRPEP